MEVYNNAMEDNRELGPTYKSLFLAACGLISLAFGWWFTNFVSSVEGLQKDYTKLEARVAELEWQRGHKTKVTDGTESGLVNRTGYVPALVP